MRLNQTVHAILCNVVEHLDGTFSGVRQSDHFGDGTFICRDTAQTSLIQARVHLLNQLKRQE